MKRSIAASVSIRAKPAECFTKPSSGARDRKFKSTIQTRPFGINENWIADFDFDVAISNRVIGTDALPKALWAALQQAEPDPMAECWRASFSTSCSPRTPAPIS